MLAVRRPRVLRSPVTAACAALVVCLVVAPTPAGAGDEASGETVVGELVQAWPEHEHPQDAVEHADEGPLTWVETNTGETVRVPTEEVTDIPVGATVEVVVGDEVRDAAAAEGQEPAREVLEATVLDSNTQDSPATAPSSSPYTNQVTVVRVVPQGGSQDGTPLEQVVDAVNGPVREFWAEQSDGAIQVGATGWPSWVATTVGCTDPWGMWREAASAVGFQPGPGKHLLLFIPYGQPNLGECAYGLAQVGSSRASGGLMYVRSTGTSVVAHELGHNFGLGHSSAWRCSAAIEHGVCDIAAYDDLYDVMGISWDRVGSLNPPQAALLGVLPTAGHQAILANDSPSARYTLLPAGGRTGLRALKLVIPAGHSPSAPNGRVYWLEYRTATGRDAWLGSATSNYPALQAGVLLRRANSGEDTSLLLDGTPAVSGWDATRQDALPVGGTVRLDLDTFSITVETTSASNAVVHVGVRGGPWLMPGEELTSSQHLQSPDGRYMMPLQPDGNLKVVARGRRVVWESSRFGSSPRLVMQTDGNLVAYTGNGSAIWQSGTWGNPGARTVLQDDGNLVVYRVDGVPLWWSGTDIPDQLRIGQRLEGNQFLLSRNGRYRAVTQTDGNVVVYGPSGRVVWANYRFSSHGRLVLQPDGNLVVYAPQGSVVWHAGTFGNPGALLAMQDDGNLVVYRPNGAAAWWTGADPRR